MNSIILALITLPLSATPPTVGVIADDLVDYSQWAAPHKALWLGPEVVAILAKNGVTPTLLGKDDMTLEGFTRFDAVLVATDHTYPEHGRWGGSVAKALVEYVRRGGVYVMPIGISHWTSKDLDSGKLDNGHFDDFFGFHGATPAGGRGPLGLTRQGRELGLQPPASVNAKPARILTFPRAAVLVWSADYLPALSAVPFDKGWLIHWGAGPEGGMDRSVRDWLISAYARCIVAARANRFEPKDRATMMRDEGIAGKSLDDLDRESFKPGPAPLASEPIVAALLPDDTPAVDVPSRTTSLDGRWQMIGLPVGTGDSRRLLAGDGWGQAIRADIPCSVQTALFKSNTLPDPVVGLNDVTYRATIAANEWWFRKTFAWNGPGDAVGQRLEFEGVDYSATFWLNGVCLGEHEGPFGGPSYDVTALLRPANELVVRLDPLPPDWKLVFKTNCVYGWHYVNCPGIGIWRPVRIESLPRVQITELFVAATDAAAGTVDLYAAMDGPAAGFSGTLQVRVAPANFEGPAHRFTLPIEYRTGRTDVHVRFQVPDPHLWWPVDLGRPDLYRLDATFASDNEPAARTARSTRFGIRTIRMAPLPGGPLPDRYNWTFVINGRPTFLKGCNWCTLDVFLQLTPDRYRRFLTLARDEHIQIMRSWGGGLLETDTFYDLCDELGIMVMQEFPLTWQEFDKLRPAVADETARLNVLRIRNHPSLAMWCGGNEHHGTGWLIELLGRRCLELDGTRPYHRTDPYGGSVHNYDVYWGRQPFEANIRFVPMENGPAVIGETGLASACAVESTLKFLPKEERNIWPPPPAGSFVHHTPTFTPENLDYLNRHARELDRCADLAGFTRGTQLAQALGLRLVLDRMRSRWPESTAMMFYKLTDVFPGCSWSTVDYYGVPKLAHWFVRDAFAPLQVCALFDSLDVEPGKELVLEPVVLDDLESLPDGATVTVRVLDALLREVARQAVAVPAGKQRVHRLGLVRLSVPAQGIAPLFAVLQVRAGDRPDTPCLDQTCYWFNFRSTPGCLFDLPATTLKAVRWVEAGRSSLVITNTGQLPAVNVQIEDPESSDSLRLEDGCFWLDPGESRKLAVEVMPNVSGEVHKPRVLTVQAWNSPPQRLNWQ